MDRHHHRRWVHRLWQLVVECPHQVQVGNIGMNEANEVYHPIEHFHRMLHNGHHKIAIQMARCHHGIAVMQAEMSVVIVVCRICHQFEHNRRRRSSNHRDTVQAVHRRRLRCQTKWINGIYQRNTNHIPIKI